MRNSRDFTENASNRIKMTYLTLAAEGVRKKGELKFELESRNVIENTCRKNVRFRPLHDVDENTQVKRVSPRC